MTHPHPPASAIIFDCDGVLVDSEAVVIKIESRLLTEAGFAMTVDEIAETCVGLSYADMMALLEKRFGQPMPSDLAGRIKTEALAAFPSELIAVPGIGDVLQASPLPRCVASSSDPDRIQLSLELTGLVDFFEPSLLFSATMVEHGKPAPDLFFFAADKLGMTPEQCVVVEDSPHGVTAAVAAGMRVIGFVAGGHARPSLEARLRDVGATEVAHTSLELVQLLG